MRTPRDLGLPGKFTRWRPNQREAVLDIASSGEGYDGLNAPTGAGKSAIYMSLASLLGGRSVILTSTKGLQDQLQREFAYAVDIRGQSNYPCELEEGKVQADAAVCHFGVPCALKGGGCSYYGAYRQAVAAPTVVTNYSYWLSSHSYGEGLGGFDTMICDEAHNVLDEVSSHLSCRITDWERDAFLEHHLPKADTKRGWWEWAQAQLLVLVPRLNAEVEELKRRPSNRSMLRRIHDLRRVCKKLKDVQDIAESNERWVHEPGETLAWTPVWPGRASQVLFRGIKKVILVSATMTPKMMELLGVEDFRYFEYPSTFDVRNRPVYHIRTGVQLRYDTDRLGLKAWMDKIDQVIQFRHQTKGIIHTVSYARRDYIMEHSRFRGYMITHGRRDTQQKVAEFKRVSAPAILVSPSMDTGVDFPDDQCRWQIIAKVPFPDSRSPVYSERAKDDKTYGIHEAVITLVQASGRGCRSERDWCETFILDDQVDWVLRKHARFVPKWFRDAYHPNVIVTPRPLVGPV